MQVVTLTALRQGRFVQIEAKARGRNTNGPQGRFIHIEAKALGCVTNGLARVMRHVAGDRTGGDLAERGGKASPP